MSTEQPLPSFPYGGNEAATMAAASPYASWGRRAAGFVLDSLLILAVGLAITGLTGHHEPWDVFKFHTVNGQKKLIPIGSKLLFFTAANTLFGFVYNAVSLGSAWQATPSMRLLGMTIATDSFGHVGYGRASARTAIFAGVSFVAGRVPFGVLLILLDLLWPIWDPCNQTLHDKLARTVVVLRPPPRRR